MHKRMLKHAGLLCEGVYADRREELLAIYSDDHKSVRGYRPRDANLSRLSEEEIEALIDSLHAEMTQKAQDRQWHKERDIEHQAAEGEISSLQPEPGENEMPPGGKMSRRYENYERRAMKMRITKGLLSRIVREEVAQAIREAMEIVNADSGEVLTVDSLPTKYADRMTKSDGHDALYDPDFEALRRDLELDPDVALDMLEEEAAGMYGDVQGDLGTAIDMAMGLKMSFPKEWAAALTTRRIKDMYYDDMGYDDEGPLYDTIDDALARFLAERMG